MALDRDSLRIFLRVRIDLTILGTFTGCTPLAKPAIATCFNEVGRFVGMYNTYLPGREDTLLLCATKTRQVSLEA